MSYTRKTSSSQSQFSQQSQNRGGPGQHQLASSFVISLAIAVLAKQINGCVPRTQSYRFIPLVNGIKSRRH
jgi:hypothetical protein